MNDLVADLRYAFRSLMRDRASVLIAVSALALCFAFNASVFSVIDAAVLNALPYPDADRLVLVSAGEGSLARVSAAQFRRWREGATALDALSGRDGTNFTLTGRGPATRVGATQITPGTFEMLGARPFLGRLFSAPDHRPGARVCVLAHAAWQRWFPDGAGTLGAALVLNGVPYTVVGVLSPEFHFPMGGPLIWLPADDNAGALAVMGRLRSRSGAADATAELVRLVENGPSADALRKALTLVPMRRAVLGRLELVLAAAGVAGLLALIAAVTSAANLFLARVSARRTELAVRAALGARSSHLARLLVAEAALVAVAAVVAGALAHAWIATAVARAWATTTRLDSEAPSLYSAPTLYTQRGLLFAAAFFAVAVAGAVIVPVWQAVRGRIALTSRTHTGRGGWTSSLLVAEQLALAMVLITVGGLVVHSLSRVLRVDAGFDARGVVVGSLSLPAAAYPDLAGVARFYAALRDRLERVPGISAAAVVDELPMNGTVPTVAVGQGDGARTLDASIRTSSVSYFDVLRIPMLAGRGFDRTDTANAPPRVVISRVVAESLFDSPSAAVGRHVVLPGGAAEVVGVAIDVASTGLDQPFAPTVYVCDQQQPSRAAQVVVRSEGVDVAADLRRELAALDGSLPLYGMASVTDVLNRSEGVRLRRSLGTAVSVFGALVLLLSAAGVFGLFAHRARVRRREMAIRAALGASPSQLRWLVLRDALALAAVATGAALLVMVAAAPAIEPLLFRTRPTEPVVLGAAALALIAITATSAWLPARRAARTDPALLVREA